MIGRVVQLPGGNYGIIEDSPAVQMEVLGAKEIVQVVRPEDLERLKKTGNRVKLKKIIGEIVSGQES